MQSVHYGKMTYQLKNVLHQSQLTFYFIFEKFFKVLQRFCLHLLEARSHQQVYENTFNNYIVFAVWKGIVGLVGTCHTVKLYSKLLLNEAQHFFVGGAGTTFLTFLQCCRREFISFQTLSYNLTVMTSVSVDTRSFMTLFAAKSMLYFKTRNLHVSDQKN